MDLSISNDLEFYTAFNPVFNTEFNQPRYEMDSPRFCPYTGPYASPYRGLALQNYEIQSMFEKSQPLLPLDLSITKLAVSKDDDDSIADKENVNPLEIKTRNQEKTIKDGNNSITSAKIICDICNKEYFSKKNLKRHKIKVHEDNPYKCNFCDKSFPKLQLLRKHKMIEHPNDSFQCDVCQKNFSVKQHLKSHQLTAHSENRQFGCKTCGKRFKTPWNLQRHQLLHEENRSWNCEVCGKDLKDNANLQAQQLSKREGKGKLVCDICAESENQTVESTLENPNTQKVRTDELA